MADDPLSVEDVGNEVMPVAAEEPHDRGAHRC